MTGTPDPVALAQALIRRPSVTPADEGALGLVAETLAPAGFACHRLRFEAPGTAPVENLYARWGDTAPVFCFAGHTDVVPPGEASGWSVDPFGGEIQAGRLFGRGAADMKGAVAAFAAAAAGYAADQGGAAGRGRHRGSIALLLTGDEEGPAVNGTKRVLDWLAERGERLDACLVGEPTNPTVLGEMMKIGRRGSLTGRLTVRGAQGHVAYPHLADNPLPRLVRMLEAITREPLDEGSAHFPPSTLALTTIDVGNPATNVIPAEGSASFNIRFNDRHSAASLEAWLRRTFDEVVADAGGGTYRLDLTSAGEAFLTEPGPLSALVAGAVERITGRQPEASTTGGTSDARFIRAHCPVVEFGLVGQTMHKTDENVTTVDIQTLTRIYRTILDDFFGRDRP